MSIWAAAAEAKFRVEGLGLERVGEGTAAVAAAGGTGWVGSGWTVAAVEGVEVPPDGTATPGSGWGCGCTGGAAVAGAVGLPDGRGDGELLGEHMPTTPRRP